MCVFSIKLGHQPSPSLHMHEQPNKFSSQHGEKNDGVSVDQSNRTTDDNADSLTERLKDVLVLPKVKSSRSTNSSARCITDDSFIKEVQEKLEEKRIREEEKEAHRIEREEKKKAKEKAKVQKQKEKKQTWEKAKLEKEMRNQTKKQMKLQEKTVKDGSAATEACVCPDCGIDYQEKETNAEWIGCDGGCGQEGQETNQFIDQSTTSGTVTTRFLKKDLMYLI